MNEGVVLLHGILRTNRCMSGLASFLEGQGYKTLNLDYPSAKYDISSIAELIHGTIKKFADKHSKIHFIGYSMGGLVIRAYLQKYRLENLGKIVMIATPNKGSEVADFLQNFWLYKKLYGPAGQQLITDQQSFKDILGDIYYDLGIISGISPYYFFGNYLIGKKNDGRVSIESSKIEGMKDQVTIKSGHTWIPSYKKTWQQAARFIATGKFEYEV